MNRKNITIKDISIKAGVSIRTVSRILNKSVYVNETTRLNVLKIIEELNYKPNLLAQKLKNNKSGTIGYIIPDFKNQFFGLVFNGIEKELKKFNYNILVVNSDGRSDLEKNCLDVLISHRVEGIIFASTGASKDYLKRQLDTFRIPIVIFDNQINGLKLNAVFHDNVKGTELLIDHLIQIHGKRKIAFIGGPIKETSCEQRLQGYKNCLLKNNIMIDYGYIKTGEWNSQSGYDLTRGILAKGEIPESIFIASTNMALGTLSYLNKKGINVPEDLSIVSFDDLDYASIIYPPLTTLNKVEEKIGCEAARILLDRINGKNLDKIEEIKIPMKMVVRQSCGCKISD